MSIARPAVLVTGATGGIGAVLSSHLLDHGYDVIAHYAGNRTAATKLELYAQKRGVQCWAVQANLSTIDGIDRLVASVDAILSRWDVLHLAGLVNNAASLLGPSFDEATPKQFDEYFALNTRAPFFLAQQLSQCIPQGGSIVNISSAGAHFSSSGDIVYAMSKAAVESMTFHAAEALARGGVRINAVIPGFTDNGNPAFQNSRAREYMSTYAVLGDVADPRDVAEAVFFLLSNRSGRITGSTIDVSGGSTLGARPPGSKLSLRYLADD